MGVLHTSKQWQNGTQLEDPTSLTTCAPGLCRISFRGLSILVK